MNVIAKISWCFSAVCSHKKDLSKKNVFSCLLNTVSEDASVTLAGRVFNTRVAVTKCVRSRSSRVRGTSSRWRDPKRSRCSTSASSLQRRSRAGYGDAMFWRKRETKPLFTFCHSLHRRCQQIGASIPRHRSQTHTDRSTSQLRR